MSSWMALSLPMRPLGEKSGSSCTIPSSWSSFPPWFHDGDLTSSEMGNASWRKRPWAAWDIIHQSKVTREPTDHGRISQATPPPFTTKPNLPWGHISIRAFRKVIKVNGSRRVEPRSSGTSTLVRRVPKHVLTFCPLSWPRVHTAGRWGAYKPGETSPESMPPGLHSGCLPSQTGHDMSKCLPSGPSLRWPLQVLG